MELNDIFLLYADVPTIKYETKDTSRGKNDFRMALFAEWNEKKLVIKITCNDFTTPERVKCWSDTVNEYLASGYYSPRIIKNRNGNYAEKILYNNKECTVFAEEFSLYKTAEKYGKENYMKDGRYTFHDDAVRSIGVIGSKHLDTADFPSGYCIFEKFAPSDPCDEVMECSLKFKKTVEEHLPQYKNKFDAIWEIFLENKEKLQQIYPELPTSVFQADLNYSNILLNNNLEFAGVLDFNLCGRDTILNYLFREAFVDFSENVTSESENKIYYSEKLNEQSLQSFINNIQIAKETYSFSETEKKAAILIYRYLRPFWWERPREICRIKNDDEKVLKLLDWIKNELTRNDIDFNKIMS